MGRRRTTGGRSFGREEFWQSRGNIDSEDEKKTHPARAPKDGGGNVFGEVKKDQKGSNEEGISSFITLLKVEALYFKRTFWPSMGGR